MLLYGYFCPYGWLNELSDLMSRCMKLNTLFRHAIAIPDFQTWML